jgi:hypothetical protein
MRYIREVHLEYPATSNQHIAEVRYSTSPTGPLSPRSREEVAQDIDAGTSAYRSHNDRNADEAAVVTRVSARGTKYIATVADGRETNNLLDLPHY